MTQEIKQITTATVTPEGKTEIKIQGHMTYKEAAEKLQQHYENGTLFENVTEAQKEELLNSFIELRKYDDFLELNELATEYIKYTPWLGEKNFSQDGIVSIRNLKNNYKIVISNIKTSVKQLKFIVKVLAL